jgi:hypothetical protein
MWQTVIRLSRAGVTLAGLFTLGACSDILEVAYPGRIPTEQLSNAALASTLVVGAVGDFECAYSNYVGGSAVHSDEYESSNGNVPLTLWAERNIGAAEDDYAIGGCETTSSFGLNLTLHTARFQAEEVFQQLDGWTDQEVSATNPQLRTSMMATVRAYGAYALTLMGESFCQVSFDGGTPQDPKAALDSAEIKFNEAITLATAAGNTDIRDMARMGLARVKMDLKKWAEAAELAGQIPSTFVKLATREGGGISRRYNKLYYFGTEGGYYTISTAYRDLDPRLLVVDAGRSGQIPGIRLWITTKYTDRGSPIRIGSYAEARLIQAEALAQQGQVAPAMAIINADRAAAGLGPLDAATQAEAVAAVLSERRVILAFEGGHRLNDLLRTNATWKVGASPFTGRPYGQTRCWPLPLKEAQGAS